MRLRRSFMRRLSGLPMMDLADAWRDKRIAALMI
jgi:hypothetical protein